VKKLPVAEGNNVLRMAPKRKKKIIIGLTGSFGSGKSTVAKYFRSYGAEVIDADKIAHSLLNPGTKIYRQIRRIFGSKVFTRGQRIDRKKIATIVFKDKKRLKKLNQIIHPQVIRMIKQQIRLSKAKAVILDVPLLIESGLGRIVDKIIVVKITRKQQLKRIKKKFSLSEADILKRIKMQLPLSRNVRMADFVIDNSSTHKETIKQAGKIRRLLWKN